MQDAWFYTFRGKCKHVTSARVWTVVIMSIEPKQQGTKQFYISWQQAESEYNLEISHCPGPSFNIASQHQDPACHCGPPLWLHLESLHSHKINFSPVKAEQEGPSLDSGLHRPDSHHLTPRAVHHFSIHCTMFHKHFHVFFPPFPFPSLCSCHMSDSGNNWLQAPRGLGSCLTLTQSCHLERFDLVEVDIYAAQFFYFMKRVLDLWHHAAHALNKQVSTNILHFWNASDLRVTTIILWWCGKRQECFHANKANQIDILKPFSWLPVKSSFQRVLRKQPRHPSPCAQMFAPYSGSRFTMHGKIPKAAGSKHLQTWMLTLPQLRHHSSQQIHLRIFKYLQVCLFIVPRLSTVASTALRSEIVHRIDLNNAVFLSPGPP